MGFDYSLPGQGHVFGDLEVEHTDADQVRAILEGEAERLLSSFHPLQVVEREWKRDQEQERCSNYVGPTEPHASGVPHG